MNARHTLQSAKLFLDIIQETRSLITGVLLKILLVLGKQNFMLLWWGTVPSLKNMELFLRASHLHARRYIVAPDFMLAVADKLQASTVKYMLSVQPYKYLIFREIPTVRDGKDQTVTIFGKTDRTLRLRDQTHPWFGPGRLKFRNKARNHPRQPLILIDYSVYFWNNRKTTTSCEIFMLQSFLNGFMYFEDKTRVFF